MASNSHRNPTNIDAGPRWLLRLIPPFHILTTTLLSLLLPLSFLLLSRLSCAKYLLTIITKSNKQKTPNFSNNFFFSFVFYINPIILYVLVAIISVSTLIHSFTGKITFLNENPYRPKLYLSWVFLFVLQISVGLGIEGSTLAGIGDGSTSVVGMVEYVNERSLLSRVVFFFGLHETMGLWSRSVVKPVVDDTVFGWVREEKWVERVVKAVSLGGLWWWKLRDEVEALVVLGELKKDVLFSYEDGGNGGMGLGDFVGWWLYYLTLTIGMVRVVKGLMWVGMILVCRRVRRVSSLTIEDDDNDNDDKV